tara:strand:- start:7980 stop:9023 length:1044 start_codon:yes stop_codon:yes gene_type:complete
MGDTPKITSLEQSIVMAKGYMIESITKTKYDNSSNLFLTTAFIYDVNKIVCREPCYHFQGIELNINEHFNGEEKCSICRADWDLKENDIIRLSCNHFFHKKCILEWFEKNESCPICRCPHDSCFNGERELGLDLLDQNTNHVINMSKTTDPKIDESGEKNYVAVVTQVLPFSIESVEKIKYSALFTKQFTTTSVISNKLYLKLKEEMNLKKMIDKPTFYSTNENKLYMSQYYVDLPINFEYLYYKNNWLTGNEWIKKANKTPKIEVRFKILNIVDQNILFVSKYDLSKNCIEPVETTEGGVKYSRMKYNDGYTDWEYLIPFCLTNEINVEFEFLGNNISSLNYAEIF